MPPTKKTFVNLPDSCCLAESTTTRKAGGLDFTAAGGKRQGREVPQSLKTTRWNRVRSMTIPLYERDSLDFRP